jgi:hypothetical protein
MASSRNGARTARRRRAAIVAMGTTVCARRLLTMQRATGSVR